MSVNLDVNNLIIENELETIVYASLSCHQPVRWFPNVFMCTCMHVCGCPRTTSSVLWVLSPLFAVKWPLALCQEPPVCSFPSSWVPQVSSLHTWDLGVEPKYWSSLSRQRPIGHPRLHRHSPHGFWESSAGAQDSEASPLPTEPLFCLV